MSSTAFTAHGERAIWHNIAEALYPLGVGDILTYERICEITERDIEQARKHVHRAVRELERTHQRTVRCVPNVGYEVVKASEHFTLARRQLRLGRRRVRRAEQIVEATNIEDLDNAERLRLESMAERTANLISMFSRRT